MENTALLVLGGFFCGCIFTGSIGLILDLRRPRNPSFPKSLPQSIQLLADHGRIKPDRTPVAVMISRSPLAKRSNLVFTRVIDRLSPIPADGPPWVEFGSLDLAMRGQVGGRHRREVLVNDVAWRTRWAEYDTSRWPTLAVESTPSAILKDATIICDEGKLLSVDYPGGSGRRGKDDTGEIARSEHPAPRPRQHRRAVQVRSAVPSSA